MGVIQRSPRRRRFLVYEARFHRPHTNRLVLIYIGRTIRTLEERANVHRRNPRSALYPHLQAGRLVDKWRVLWEGESYRASMYREILEIKKAKGIPGVRCLNRTRGGWHDYEDSGVEERRLRELRASGRQPPPSIRPRARPKPTVRGVLRYKGVGR